MFSTVDKPLVHCRVHEQMLFRSEEYMVDDIVESLLHEENIILCTSRKYIFSYLILKTLIMDETIGFQKRENPSKRAEILVITNRFEMLDFLGNCSVNTERLFQICSNIHRYIGFCNMGDEYFTRVYWRHILYHYYEGNLPQEVPFHYVFPVASGYRKFNALARGNRNALGRRDSQNPTIYVTENLEMLKEQEQRFDYIFVDCSYIKKYIPHLPKGTLLFFDNPLDDRIQYLQKNSIKNYIVDRVCLENIDEKELGQPMQIIEDSLQKMSIHSLNVEYVKSSFEQEIERLIYLLDKLRKTGFSRYDSNIAAKLIYILIRLPISAEFYDLIVLMQPHRETIQGLLQELKDSENRYENNFFEEIILLFEDILYKNSLDHSNVKGEKLKESILNEVKQGKSVCVVSNSRNNQLALKEYISLAMGIQIEDLSKYDLQFFVSKDIYSQDMNLHCDSLFLYSAINFKDLQPLLKISYRRATLYLYKSEINLITQKLKKIIDAKNYALSHFVQNSGQLDSTNLYKYLYNRFNKFSRQKVISLNSEAADLLEKSTSVFPRVFRGEKDYKGTDAVKATLVRFTDGSVSFFTKKSAVYVLDNKNKRVTHKYFHEIGLKDSILFVDNDARKDLYRIFIQSIDAKDTSKQAYLSIKKWRELYEEKFLEKRMDDDRLFRLMRSAGWNKTTKSVLRNWRTGYSYDPRDKEDIIVLGEVLGINSFVEDVHFYYNAMSKIRLERRKASRILNRLIYSSNQILGNEEEAILTRYNLTLEQLNESVVTKRMKEIVSDRMYYIKPAEVGLLYNVDSKE
ncbi:DISARM system-associated protein DrmE [Bacillus safensis]|uniref:DISARM system-associated protein DrmE n=1 Tax=Bacillus safensis TaxID=561879 RepID=UPI002E22E95B|nr:DISARM system-associated protein DrmE [Bacillus safensis]MED0916230.1 DISARM system-associated protein DrmE [Bacillus safensis]